MKRFISMGLIILWLVACASPSFAFSKTLKWKMTSPEVSLLQNQLKQLGLIDKNAKQTNYFGTVTKAAVMKFQKENSLTVDGIVGSKTADLLAKKAASISQNAPVNLSRGQDSNALMPNWFDEGRYIFTTGMTAEVYDVVTGKRFNIVYSMSSRYHADCETVSSKDTLVMLELWGSFHYGTRAIILTFNGRSVAASMAGNPHCGLDALPFLQKLTNGDAEGNYVGRENCDKIKGNLMDGHFDVHFYKSLNHYNGLESKYHQSSVLQAFEWAKANMPDGKLPPASVVSPEKPVAPGTDQPTVPGTDQPAVQPTVPGTDQPTVQPTVPGTDQPAVPNADQPATPPVQ